MAEQTLDPLTPEQYGIVMDEISRASVALEVGFSIRFDWRKQLPWLLIGMANPRVDRAKHFAQQCIIEYNKKTRVRASPEIHPITKARFSVTIGH